MSRQLVETLTRFLARLFCRQQIVPPPGIVKVNLGSGLRVAPDWINVDGSLSALIAHFPTPLQEVTYRFTSMQEFYSQAEYIAILKNNTFVFHNLAYGVPFPDHSVDYFYASHLLEHLFKAEAERLLQDVLRALKKQGRIRIGVTDLEHAFKLYGRGAKEQALNLFFLPAGSGFLGRHEYMYDFDLLAASLERTGFTQIERCEYQNGGVPDLNLLDHSPDQTLFVEASKA